MNFFDHKDLGNHLLQLCPKVVEHPVYIYNYQFKSSINKTTKNKRGLLYPVFFLFEVTKVVGIMSLCRWCFLVTFRALMGEAVAVVGEKAAKALGSETSTVCTFRFDQVNSNVGQYSYPYKPVGCNFFLP